MIKQATDQLIKLNCHLASLSRANHYSETLKLFQQIHSSHLLRPDHYTLSTSLSAASHRRDSTAGSQLHAHSLKSGLISYAHVANTLLSLYSKLHNLRFVKWIFNEIQDPDVYSWTTLLSACVKLGDDKYACKVFDEVPQRDVAVENACQVFDELPQRDVSVWNAVITGCAENGYVDFALDLFKRMHRLGIRHDNYTFASILSSCSMEMVDLGKQVHSLVIRTVFSGRVSVINAQIGMYFTCHRVIDAYKVFEEADTYDSITYNSMIAGLVRMERDKEALLMFREMKEVSLRPTELTFVSIMSSCSCPRIGLQLHVHVIEMGFDTYTSVGNAAITMYSSSGDLYAACSIFENLQNKDLISWNTIISCYAQEKMADDAMYSYIRMQTYRFEPDEFTIGSLLTISESIENVEIIQALVIKNGLEIKVEISNALISAFSRHGDIEHAYKIFEKLSFKNLISWNAIISGLQLNGVPLHGLEQFSSMLFLKFRPNAYSLTIILSICSDISSLKYGKEVHGYLLRQGFFSEITLGNSLITLYSKTGVLNWSFRVFNTMVFKDTITWNSLISAYAQHGYGQHALGCFKAMIDTRSFEPDYATFTCVLSACSHAGLVEDGLKVFNSMVNCYGFEPKGDHFSCIVDLLGRAGYLDEAERLVVSGEEREFDVNSWWTLFSSSVNYGDIRLGRIVAEILLENCGNDPTVYVQLSNVYSAAGLWEEAANVRDMMERVGLSKTRGCSWTVG